ncbi:hypothetical protein Bhyg_08362 [Pseudolycoriella hygida]|uniref:Uncharacterized protein n=1 Tax=Pseudolycoriella hygida TaxID=35572 RepID=A0A9Q0N5U1_9DIPT|nr:hypothetical protein Bhyg_08362 [Pseudolycoriella hygida]
MRLQSRETVEVYEGRPKRGRKRKISSQSRGDRKKLFNTNKPHINSRGNAYQEKIFDPTFECLCSRECTSAVPIENRQRLFNQFWNMGSFEGRRALLMTSVRQEEIKQTRYYSIYGTSVCTKALLGTLQINDSRVYTAINKYLNCDTFCDLRGKLSGGWNVLPQSKTVEVRRHIDSFPKYVSHYTREKTDSKYLNPHFNLRFKHPKIDTCLKCDIYKVEAKATKLQMIEKWHRAHLAWGESLQAQMKADCAAAKVDSDFETLIFDFRSRTSPQASPIINFKSS